MPACGSQGKAHLHRTVRSSRELTPAQHAAIRRQLLFIPVYIWIVYAWGVFFAHLPVGNLEGQTHVTRDFVHFYAQGAITRDRDAHALYDIDEMAAAVDRVVPVKVDVKFPPVYGPQVGLFFAPLAALPYVPALLVWLAVTITLYAACVYAVWRAGPAPRLDPWSTIPLALGWAGLHFTLSFGQASIIGTVCMTALWLALRDDRKFLAGLAVGALAYKPPLGVVAAFVFVLGREWRTVAGAIVAVAAQAVAALAYWGPDIFVGYVTALTRLPEVIDGMEPDKVLMHSWRAAFLHLGLPSEVALAASLVTSVATIALAVVCWRTGGPLALRYVVLVLATLLVDSHLYAYDLMLLAPALLIAWQWAREAHPQDVQSGQLTTRRWGEVLTRGQPIVWLAGFVYVAPLATIIFEVVPVQWSVVGFVALSLWCTAILTRGTVEPTVNI